MLVVPFEAKGDVAAQPGRERGGERAPSSRRRGGNCERVRGGRYDERTRARAASRRSSPRDASSSWPCGARATASGRARSCWSPWAASRAASTRAARRPASTRAGETRVKELPRQAPLRGPLALRAPHARRGRGGLPGRGRARSSTEFFATRTNPEDFSRTYQRRGSTPRQLCDVGDPDPCGRCL